MSNVTMVVDHLYYTTEPYYGGTRTYVQRYSPVSWDTSVDIAEALLPVKLWACSTPKRARTKGRYTTCPESLPPTFGKGEKE